MSLLQSQLAAATAGTPTVAEVPRPASRGTGKTTNDQAPDCATQDQSGTTIAAPVSWKEIARIVACKLKASVADHRTKSKTYVVATAIVAGILMIPWPHTVSCHIVCEPVVRRYVAAPFDATLLRTQVVVGQDVEKGDVLALLDGGELHSQLAGVRAKLAQARQRQLAALSTGDHSKAEFERLEVEHLDREIELLESRQVHLEIRSPMDGTVVMGDLERAQGAPLKVGDNLFEIADLTQLIAEAAVPEGDVCFVTPEMQISITLDSASDRTFESRVDRIDLRNEIRDQQSVYVAEAVLYNEGSLLRPGMSGTGTIHAGRRSLAWILFHRPYDAARQCIGW